MTKKPVILVVNSKVRGIVKKAGLRTGGDFIEALSEKVESIVTNAIHDVQENKNRQTLGREDVPN